MAGLVALTGATGFIGQVVLHKLVASGYDVRALARKPIANCASVKWVHGDLSSTTALHELVKDSIAVIHCAGVVRGSSLEYFLHTNVEGTFNLVRAATAQAIKPRFLLISSLAARQPEISWYAKSKRLAEQCVIDNSSGLPWTIFRPTAVYGPGDKELKPLFNATRRGFLPVAGDLSNNFSLLHVNDFVAAIQSWLTINAPIKGVFELGDGKPGGYNYQTIATLTQEIWGLPVRCIKIPTSIIRMVANTNLRLARIFHYAPMLTPGIVREFLHPDWVCDNTPLTNALPDWHPTISLHDALPELFHDKQRVP
jgi:nucleoside-diphosphate-sugar epimerase